MGAGVTYSSLMEIIHSWVIMLVAVWENVSAAGLVFLCGGHCSSSASSLEMIWSC